MLKRNFWGYSAVRNTFDQDQIQRMQADERLNRNIKDYFSAIAQEREIRLSDVSRCAKFIKHPSEEFSSLADRYLALIQAPKNSHRFQEIMTGRKVVDQKRQEFIEKAKQIHKGRYDYSKVEFVNYHTPVTIIDPEYGEFQQAPMSHLYRAADHPARSHAQRGRKRRLGKEKFIELAKKRHGDFYDYSKVVYTHIDEKVCIIDPEYGEFWQSPYQHLRSHGCPARSKDRKWHEHTDHIIPLALVYCRKKGQEWAKERPLFLLLDSDINKKKIEATENRKKSDNIIINGTKVRGSIYRNNYEVIEFLIKKHLHIDPSEVIEQDRKFMLEKVGLCSD